MAIRSREVGKADDFGNEIYMTIFSDISNSFDVSATIWLKLKSENEFKNKKDNEKGYRRMLGHLYLDDNSFHVIRDSSKHYHRITKGYGFNWNVLNDSMLPIKTIYITIDKKETYAVPKSILENMGIYLYFKEQGFELQKFLPLSVIEQFKVDYDKDKYSNLSHNNEIY